MFCEKGVLRNFAKFTGKPLRQGLFLNKVADFFFYFLHSVFLLFSIKNKTLHLLISVVFVSCGYGMQPTVFHELPSTRYRERLILDSLYPMSGPCSCSKFSCKFCEISKNTFIYRAPLMAASEHNSVFRNIFINCKMLNIVVSIIAYPLGIILCPTLVGRVLKL